MNLLFENQGGRLAADLCRVSQLGAVEALLLLDASSRRLYQAARQIIEVIYVALVQR
jgi:hypothetical protein